MTDHSRLCLTFPFLFLSPLQSGGFGEPTDRQPHGPEQPLHPSRSREQLLILPAPCEGADAMPQFWEKTLLFFWEKHLNRNRYLGACVTDPRMCRSVKEEPLPSGFMSSLTPARRSLRLRSSQNVGETVKELEEHLNLKRTLLRRIFLTFLYCGLSYKHILRYYWQKCH